MTVVSSAQRDAAVASPDRQLRVRWLGEVGYEEGDAVQRALHAGDTDYLLLLEHPSVYTFGTRARPDHVLVDPASVGATLVHADRGGDVTYHGPGQLVGYPVVTLAPWRAGRYDLAAYVRRLEEVLIRSLRDLGLEAARRAGFPGVWVGRDKIAAVGVRVAAGRTRHGFALNVDPDLTMFSHIVPCGIADAGVTSLAVASGAAPPVEAVAATVAARFVEVFGYRSAETQAVTARRAGSRGLRRDPVEAAAGEPATPPPESRPARPEWMRVRARLGDGYARVRRLSSELSLNTVCREAGCPNIYECWADRTATFMILGDRCTRACDFCLVDTRRPIAPDPGEPDRVAAAVHALGLEHAVITCVARDDLPDGGASAFAATVRSIREASPETAVELLISDCRGRADALDVVFAARPDVLGHNLETVARLQRAVRPSAGYARSLAVLARAKAAGLVTKSGLMVGLDEQPEELRGALADLAAVGVDVVTIGQYLAPSPRHRPVARWWTPAEFDEMAEEARELGFAHVEAGPLVRSSYHARRGAAAVGRPGADDSLRYRGAPTGPRQFES